MNSSTIKENLELLEGAISDRTVLLLNYRSPATGNRSERKIEPLAIYFTQDKWMLVAFCRLRTEEREFRLDGVLSLTKTDINFPPHQFTLN